MTFESLAIAGLSLGLTLSDILNMRVGLTIGLINEKNNQMIEFERKQKEKNKKQEAVQGSAEMLMNM